MFFVAQLAIAIGLSAVSMALQPRARKLSSTAAPTNLAKWNLPTTEQRTPIPWAAGTVLIDNPGLLWAGDFSAVEIKDGIGNVTGYKYHVGLMLGLCLGPIDAVRAIHWDGRALPGGPIGVGAESNSLAIYDGGLKVAHIAEGFYATPHDLAVATSAALDAAGGYVEPHYRVRFGHQVVAGWNDRFRYAVRVSGVWQEREAILEPGSYESYLDPKHPELLLQYRLFDELERAVNANEATCAHRLTIAASRHGTSSGDTVELAASTSDASVTGLRVLGLSDDGDLVNLNLGMHINVEVVAELARLPGSIYGAFGTWTDRMIFGGGADGTILAWTRSETTCQGLLGATGNRDYWAIGASAEREIESPTASLTQTDLGERVRIEFSALHHFGPDDGVSGVVDIWKGSRTQPVDDYLVTRAAIGPPLPAYRGLAYAVLRKCYVGNNPQFRGFAVLLQRFPNPLGLPDEIANLGGMANPALLLYEALTGGVPLSHRPLRPDQVQASDYVAAAWTLFREQRGMRAHVDTPMTRTELELWVGKHVDGWSYRDPLTGKRRFRLAREDYDVASLPHLGPAEIVSCKQSAPSWGKTKNVVRVTYIDAPGGYVERTVTAVDDANIAAQGGRTVEEDVTLDGFTNARDAQWAADRMLRTLSWPGSPLEIEALPVEAALAAGSPFVLDWPALGIANVVCRALDPIDRGSLSDRRVKFSAQPVLETLDQATYGNPQAPAWETPTELPGPPAAARLVEVPYALLAGRERAVFALAARADDQQYGFEAHADLAGGADYRLANRGARFTPSGTLSGLMGWTGTAFTVRDGRGTERLASISAGELALGFNLALIEDEWIVWETLVVEPDGGLSFTGVVRGVLDSVPAVHEAGTRVWFISAGAPLLTEAEPEADAAIAAKLLTINRAGRMPLAIASRHAIALAERAMRPYPPTDVRFDGVLYPDQVAAPVTLTWSHRDRTGAWSFADAGATAEPEAGTTYELTVWDDAGEQVLQETIAGTSHELTALAQGWRVRLIAIRDGLRSTAYDYTIGTNHGWGLAWGENWGGYQAE